MGTSTAAVSISPPTTVPVTWRHPPSQSLGFFCFLAERGRSYSTLHAEALRLFCTLQQLEGVADLIPVIQGILQTGHDLRPLRDELYCQLIKQTTRPPEPGGPAHISGWRVIACMCCTFSPISRSILKYLKFHIKRSVAVCVCVSVIWCHESWSQCCLIFNCNF